MDLPFATGIIPHPIEAEKVEQKKIWQRFSKWIGRDDPPHTPPPPPCPPHKHDVDSAWPSIGRRLSRKVVPGLPRPATFRRQNSERRDRLTPVQRRHVEPRAASVDRRRAMSARPPSPTPIAVPKLSAPAICNVDHGFSQSTQDAPYNGFSQGSNRLMLPGPTLPPSPPPDVNPNMSEESYDNMVDDVIQLELEEKWILNLSMHFRDRSPREKFFVTYAETPTRWRRVTVSCDYRDAPPDSLERDLQSLQYQRDKSARIYEAIRMSLADIQFYNTVTNLKLETSPDDRLHVHVTEDVNEIIPYPSIHAVQHLRDINIVSETDVNFEAHTSGFVYRVRVNGQVCIKKEIPGPDSVDEFLYEVNALHALIGSQHVIQFRGLVVDERNSLIKGLLISFAEQGSLVDTLFDCKGQLSWPMREKWAKQIITGLSEIHEAGFVQGDFTLSNIVIDINNDAHIIDINRRGCPVGWEPPEIKALIESGQRISTYIGVKSDLFQLGMVLWGLAAEEDEPERQPRQSLNSSTFKSNIPGYFCSLVDICLSKNPRERLAAKELLARFPKLSTEEPGLPLDRMHSLSVPSETQYIDPKHAVEREDLDFHNRNVAGHGLSSDSHTYVDRPGSADHLRSLCVPRRERGRQPAMEPNPSACVARQSRSNSREISPNQSEQEEPQIISVSPGEHLFDEVEIGGLPYIIPKDSLEFDSEDVGQSRGLRIVRRPMSSFLTGQNEQEGIRQLLDHTDSGLADMDLTTGVGGHEVLRGYHMRATERLKELETDDAEEDSLDSSNVRREEGLTDNDISEEQHPITSTDEQPVNSSKDPPGNVHTTIMEFDHGKQNPTVNEDPLIAGGNGSWNETATSAADEKYGTISGEGSGKANGNEPES